MVGQTLTPRQLNRATLARQMLLERQRMPLEKAVGHFVAIQAQLPRPPFVGLWSRLEGVRREAVAELFRTRRLVRATAMRGTLHAMRADDFLAFRGCLQQGLDRAGRVLGNRLKGLDIDGAVKVGRRYFENAATFDAFRDHLEAAYPKADIRALAYAVRMRVPLVQVPTDAPWGYPSQAEFVSAEKWLGRDTAREERVGDLVLRYLAAYGPAGVADVQAWSGLQGLRPVLESRRAKLRVFKVGRTDVFDLPDAPRPDEDVPSPVRFLPEFDSAIVCRADARLLDSKYRNRVFVSGLRVLPTFLVDGRVAGIWKIERQKAAAALILEPFGRLPPKVRGALEKEGEALMKYAEPDATKVDVRVVS
jgi:hypothetical protein